MDLGTQAAIGGWHCLAVDDQGHAYAWGMIIHYLYMCFSLSHSFTSRFVLWISTKKKGRPYHLFVATVQEGMSMDNVGRSLSGWMNMAEPLEETFQSLRDVLPDFLFVRWGKSLLIIWTCNIVTFLPQKLTVFFPVYCNFSSSKNSLKVSWLVILAVKKKKRVFPQKC